MTIFPAPLIAQTLGGTGFPSLTPPGAGAKDFMPGAPVITNPTALQPLAPPQTPCPAPPSKTPPPIAPTGPTLNDFWPADSAAVLPPSADTRIRLERDERFKREQRDDVLKHKQEMTTADIDVRSKQEREEKARLAQQAVQLTSKDYSVEEAFAQFSVLQNVKSRLHQFGYDFFDTQATSFAPVPDAPVGPDYVVGPLDSLSIHIWNVPEQSLNRSYIVPVERDGTIVIPQIGTIPVGGLTFSQTEKAITNRLSAHLKRFEVHVAMARLRTLKVYVVGEVVRPG
ncbi:MAG TPA: polysaccharide biosynthesis/export family protein, partial [Nitrospira sp.]|nr:polysaccharide biosynthesis/export family protein [Nitrospira sp.]